MIINTPEIASAVAAGVAAFAPVPRQTRETKMGHNGMVWKRAAMTPNYSEPSAYAQKEPPCPTKELAPRTKNAMCRDPTTLARASLRFSVGMRASWPVVNAIPKIERNAIARKGLIPKWLIARPLTAMPLKQSAVTAPTATAAVLDGIMYVCQNLKVAAVSVWGAASARTRGALIGIPTTCLPPHSPRHVYHRSEFDIAHLSF